MKKLILVVVALLVMLAAATYFVAPLRQKLVPYMPQAVARLLPADAAPSGGAPGKSAAAGGQDKAGGRGGPVAVAVATAAAADMPLIERTYGAIQSPAVATINARIASQVTEVHVKDGQMVKAGDLLLVLDDRLLQAQLAKDQATLAKDKALAASSELDLQRAKQLAVKQAGTQQAADQANAAAQAARATVDADKAAVLADQAQLTFTRIAAPISGRLGAVQVHVGDLVGTSGNASAGLMSITEMAPLKVAFRLPERVLAPVRKAVAGGGVPVRVLRAGTATQLEQGTLDFIDSAIDTASGTIAMSATIANQALALWPGQFADVEVQYGKLPDAVTVPSVAVQPGQSGPFVWLVKPDSTVEARPVKVTHTEGALAAIAEGLANGDRVVVEGQLRLKPGAAVMIGQAPAGPALADDGQAKPANP